MSGVMNAPQEQATIEEDLLSALQCPVCFDYMVPPITLCQNGHNICQECKPKFSNCPTCRRHLMDVRNVALEGLARTLQYPCRYCDDGCVERYSLAAINAHQLVCSHRIYDCLLQENSCRWQGKLSSLQAHMATTHPKRTSLFTDTDASCVVWEISQAGCFRDYSHVVFAFGEIFQYHKRFNIKEKKLYFLVQHVGAKDMAAKFKYKYIMTRNNDKIKISLSCAVHTEKEDINATILSRNCISVDFDTLVTFGKGKRYFHIMRKKA